MTSPNFSLEEEAWTQGYRLVAGIDEAGRGAWAGPVAAAAVIFPPDCPDLCRRLHGVRDSKELTARRREELFVVVQREAVAVGIGMVGSDVIVEEGIGVANRRAMVEAIQALVPRPDHLLIDYLRLPQVDLPQTSLRKGDQRSLSIAAASIIAKVTRDRLMIQMAVTFPLYRFEQHKGYGTRLHREALEKHGLTLHHRRNWKPFDKLQAVSNKRSALDIQESRSR